MNRRMPVRARCTIAVAGLLMLVGCGKHEPATSVAPAAASVRPAAAAAATSGRKVEATPAASVSKAAPAVATSAAAPTPMTKPAFLIQSLTLGDAVEADHRISEPGNRFSASDKTLYASVASTGSSSEISLTATWRYLEGRGRLIREVSQSIATDGPAITTFELHNPDLWPEGKYQVDITVDGKPAASQHFEITKSP
ncbi:MAG: hypothetical protein ABI268_12800 [Rhodanobacter sp.]